MRGMIAELLLHKSLCDLPKDWSKSTIIPVKSNKQKEGSIASQEASSVENVNEDVAIQLE